jgi:hypothetical protein
MDPDPEPSSYGSGSGSGKSSGSTTLANTTDWFTIKKKYTDLFLADCAARFQSSKGGLKSKRKIYVPKFKFGIKILYPAGYRIWWPDIRPDAAYSRISGKSIRCDHDSFIFFIKTFFGNKNCLFLQFEKYNIHKSGLIKLTAGHIYNTGIYFYVEPDIRQDVRYPAWYPVSGFQVSWISGQMNIRPNQYTVHPYFKYGYTGNERFSVFWHQ